jgi:CDP-diglyceride synthetase
MKFPRINWYDFATHLVNYFHLLGLGILLGSTLTQVNETEKRVTKLMLSAALMQFLATLALLGLNKQNIQTPKTYIPLILALATTTVMWIKYHKPFSSKLYYTTIFLILLQLSVEVFWP